MSTPAATDCPFCTLPPTRIVHANQFVVVIRDAYPVSRGHTLVLPRRHVGSFFEIEPPERDAVFELLDVARRDLDQSLHPDGYNIGINDGPAAGQTVPHLHVHLIPRYNGDQADPRGGVRWIFPERADYWFARGGEPV
ncbi:MAG TPA: HIT family protein [Ottowia sp.]|nr:HIT family protein [Ottowia sp.]